MKTSTPRLSAVIPVFNEEKNLSELCRRTAAAFSKVSPDYELILVDDGSTDNTLPLLRAEAEKNEHIKFLSFSRNFGHQTAVSAGLNHASGDAVMVLDGDLQDPPELISEFKAKWQEGFEVVYGVRKNRKEPFFLKAAYFLFYRLLQKISHVQVPLDAGDFCLMDRKVLNVLKQMPEQNRFLRGLRAWAGFRQCGLPYDRPARAEGESKYNWLRLFRLAVDGITGFSDFPLTVCGYLGFTISFLSILGFLWSLARKLIFHDGPWGWASMMSAIFFLGGIQLIILSIMGSYIARIYKEVQARPLFITKETHGFSPSETFSQQH